MYRKYIKRLSDLLFSLIILPFILFIILICGLLIKLEDGGSVFYFGKRLGRNGRVFKMYKLRTMKENVEDLRNPDGSTYNSDMDPRLTKIGKILRKTSIDELPQIFNVVIGDMSFIGPRPDLPEHLNYYKGNELKKLEVLPGISGFNQAYFRNSIPWEERLKNDVFYVEQISFFFDLKILFRTLVGIVLRRGIYTNQKLGNTGDLNNGNREVI